MQALGNSLRDAHLRRDPIFRLDGDDRTGANTGGENLFVDLRLRAERSAASWSSR